MYGWIAFMAHWSTELTTIDWKSIFLLLLLRFGNIRIKSHWSILWMRSRILSVCMYDDSESGGQIDLMNSLMSLCRNGLNHRFQWFLFEITAKLNVARKRIECVYMSEHASLNCKQNSIQMEWWIQNTQTHTHASTLAHAVTFLNYQKNSIVDFILWAILMWIFLRSVWMEICVIVHTHPGFSINLATECSSVFIQMSRCINMSCLLDLRAGCLEKMMARFWYCDSQPLFCRCRALRVGIFLFDFSVPS